jgi:hypothetical protein
MRRDLRRHARETKLRLAVGFIVLLFVVGDGLIYLFYGSSAALSGLFCLFAGLLPIGLIVAFFALLDWIRKRARG